LLNPQADLEILSEKLHRKTALHFAARLGFLDMAHALIQAGANIHDQRSGESVLHVGMYKTISLCVTVAASRYGRPFIVHYLLKIGVNPDLRDALGHTALHVALFKNQAECVKLLVYGGADVRAVDNEGLTPLHWAALGGSVETSRVLLRELPADAYKATVNFQGKSHNAFQLAELKQNKRMAEHINKRMKHHRRNVLVLSLCPKFFLILKANNH